MALSVEQVAGFNFTPKRYGIIGLVGNRETGKTTWGVKTICREAITKKHYKKFKANLHIGLKIDKLGNHYGSPGVDFITYDDFMAIKEPSPNGIPSCLVLIDQIHRWFDARASASKQNREFSDKIVQSRQHGFDLITTTWGNSSIDLRLRRFYELLIRTKRGRNCFLYDYWDVDTGPICPTKEMPFDQARGIFPYFNTAEEVLPPPDADIKKRN